jgi:effector-binding domain-containing protein
MRSCVTPRDDPGMSTTERLDLTVTHVPEQTFAYVVRRVLPHEAPEFVQGAIARVLAFAEAYGAPQGPPTTISSAPDDAGAVVLEVGWPVSPGTTAEPPVEVRALPPTIAVVHLHVGPYEELPAVYGAVQAEARAAGYVLGGAPRERYLAWPGDDPPVTEIVWPVS